MADSPNPWAPPTLRTERLVIRPFTVGDLEAVHAYVRGHDPAVYGSWLGGGTAAEVTRYLADTVARYGRPSRCDLGISTDGVLVGGVAFRQTWISPPTFEVGWVLNPSAAGQGFTREALTALLRHLFTAFPAMARAEARVRLADTSGIRMLEALGFVREGLLRYGAGVAGDAGFYGLLRLDWKA
jgi:RimJ/RimL family protein N-acetyltransferase